MSRTLLTVVSVIVLGLAGAAIGEALDFSGVAYFGVMLVGMLLVSLTDRERFWGVPPRHRP